MRRMRRNLLSALLRHEDEAMRHSQEVFDSYAEAVERLLSALDRFNTRQARITSERVAELDAWSAASRIRRRELVEKAEAWASSGSRLKS
jgi:hypothetical protein